MITDAEIQTALPALGPGNTAITSRQSVRLRRGGLR